MEPAFPVEMRHVRGDAAMESVPDRIRCVRGGVSTALRTPGVLVPFGHSASLDMTSGGRGRRVPEKATSSRLRYRSARHDQ